MRSEGVESVADTCQIRIRESGRRGSASKDSPLGTKEWNKVLYSINSTREWMAKE